jgi:small-conductance mechanosensitive channel
MVVPGGVDCHDIADRCHLLLRMASSMLSANPFLEQLRSWIDSQPWLRDYEFLGNTAGRWLLAFALLVVTTLILLTLRSFLSRRIGHWVGRTENDWDDAAVHTLRETRGWFLLLLAVFIASTVLTFPDAGGQRIREVLQTIVILALLLQIAFWGNVFIKAALERYAKRKAADDPAAVTTVSALAFVGKLILFSLLVLLALDNLGIDVTALITGLGVGGIAVALAVQNILGDLLASLSIVFDKPFVLGDFIIVGDKMGTVEKIGLKTTRLKSISGEQLVFSNNDLLQSRIQNYKRMQERRVVFKLGVTYETPREQLREIPTVIQEVIESQNEIRFDRAHFASFGDFSLDFEVVYFVLKPDYNLYMDIQQAINLAIHERFEAMSVEFAFPTQTIQLQRD